MMIKTPLRIFQGALLLMFFSSQLAFAQTSAEFKAVQKELQVIQKELQLIKEGQLKIQRDVEQVLRQAPGGKFMSFADDPVKGNKNAKVTVLEFSDYG